MNENVLPNTEEPGFDEGAAAELERQLATATSGPDSPDYEWEGKLWGDDPSGDEPSSSGVPKRPAPTGGEAAAATAEDATTDP